MAITKTITLKEVVVFPTEDSSAASTTNAGNPSISITELIVLDDANDDQLPLESKSNRSIYRYVTDGGAATDVSSEDSLIQSIAGAIWS